MGLRSALAICDLQYFLMSSPEQPVLTNTAQNGSNMARKQRQASPEWFLGGGACWM